MFIPTRHEDKVDKIMQTTFRIKEPLFVLAQGHEKWLILVMNKHCIFIILKLNSLATSRLF